MKKPKAKVKRVRRLLRVREVRLLGVELVLELPSKRIDEDAAAFAKLVRTADRYEERKTKRQAEA